MATDLALSAFTALDDDAVAAYADTRAETLGFTLPPETRAGVIENLALLRRQTATFTAALGEAPAPEAFEP